MTFEEQSPLNYEKLAEAQDSDPSISLLQQSDNSLQISTQKLPKSNRTILVDTSTGIARPLVPIAFRRKVFDLLHGLAHPGIKSSQKLISFRNALCGQKFTLMSETGQKLVSHAKERKSTDTMLPPYTSIPLLMNASPTFT